MTGMQGDLFYLLTSRLTWLVVDLDPSASSPTMIVVQLRYVQYIEYHLCAYNVKRLAVIDVYTLCITLCIRSMYKSRNRLREAASLTYSTFASVFHAANNTDYYKITVNPQCLKNDEKKSSFSCITN
jgi:hypothetical protein